MDFFDKLGKKASDTYKYTAEKTGKLAKEAKLRMKMNENKSEINDLYKQIGKKVYEKHIVDDVINIKEELEEECTQIDVLSQEIENMLKEILTLKDKKQCHSCFEQIDKDAQYCPRCGTKQEKVSDIKDVVDGDPSEESSTEEPAKEVEVIDDNSNNTDYDINNK